jgi:cytochrome c oxidase cbb3-type subunit 2
MTALRRVGVPYSDAEIAKAGTDIKGKTELDALVAYLQGMGLALTNNLAGKTASAAPAVAAPAAN